YVCVDVSGSMLSPVTGYRKGASSVVRVVDVAALFAASVLRKNPRARLVCIDVQPNQTVQAQEREDVLNVGGFSDRVFDVVAEFAAGRLNANHWVGLIEQVEL
ncbi:MAG TPA: hypothetical protein VGV59_20120, partial [Pyrinomonadaceae bacterium]|nr:hypothetical protein [Pyrinomonadaceae bacterium]